MALNSWTASHGATFRSPAGDSRIDHILTKHRDADNKAKQGALLDEAPFLPAGAHHVPMLTSLNYKYYRPPRQQQHCFSREVKRKCLDEFRQGTLHWQQCENGINHALRSQSGLHSLGQIHQILAQGAIHYFKTSMTRRPDDFGSHVASKWLHYKKLKQHCLISLSAVFFQMVALQYVQPTG